MRSRWKRIAAHDAGTTLIFVAGAAYGRAAMSAHGWGEQAIAAGIAFAIAFVGLRLLALWASLVPAAPVPNPESEARGG